jgi:uncharacterized protein with PhoU and TrkA domain
MADEVGDVDEIVDQAISRKRNVKDILVEMKDTSELMVDLAYSALFTNSKDISEEVQKLEQRVDDLRYEIETLLLLAARTPEEAADLSGIMHVAVATENIADSAEDIADVVLRGVGDHPIYKTMLGEAEEQVVRTEVAKGSELDGKTLGEFRVSTKTGCYIRAIRRGGEWIYNPKKDTKILEGDILIASGSENSVNLLKELSKRSMDVSGS